MFGIFNFSANPEILYRKCTQFPIEFSQIWTFHLSEKPDIPYIFNVHNFPLNFCKSRYAIFLPILTYRTYNIPNFSLNFRKSGHSIFLQIQTFRTCNVHNFRLSLRSSRQTIFLQIQTFCTNIMYTIFCRIYAVLDVQFFCKSKHSVHVLYTISN